MARLARCEARHGKRAKKPEAYPPRHTEDFFAKFDEVAARTSSILAEDIYETSSTYYVVVPQIAIPLGLMLGMENTTRAG